jgi:hypothetical protein
MTLDTTADPAKAYPRSKAAAPAAVRFPSLR